ncbi:MAG: hypothetical protein LBB62_03545 [Proteiniphilum sp.]|jgi:hypothetical protein|nr:hypothetical protein [Proteiniphilum sp.]
MTYCKQIETLDGLKSEYRKLAMENHPDIGGSVEAMQEINRQFETMFHILNITAPAPEKAETASGFRREFYTQSGWAGSRSRYNTGLSLKEIAKIVRDYIKDVYPTWKFSVTTHYASMCRELSVNLMETPVDIFDKDRMQKAAENATWKRHYQKEDEVLAHFRKMAYEEGYIQNWNRWTDDSDLFTDYARKVLDDVHDLVESYNMRDCDAQIDYFNVNFYTSFNIGRWDRPLRIVPRMARITTKKVDNRLKRVSS